MRSISDEELSRIFREGRDRAREIAAATMREVRARLGIVGA
jgi:hypothetical protein